MGISPSRTTQYTYIVIWAIMAFGGMWIVFHEISLAKNLIWTQNMLNPLIDYTGWKNSVDEKEIDLEKPLQEYIQEKKYSNEVTHVSVYYRNLNNGNWFGINEKEMFSPASLMKLPLLLVYLKKIEQDPSVRDQKLTYREDPIEAEYIQDIVPQKKLVDKQSYTIKELLEYMIRYSDNKASLVLERNINVEDYKKAFTDNNMIFPDLIDGRFDNNLKVIEYAKFFSVLFNSSYVNKELSNYALWLLTKVDFKQWLVAGIEDNTIVAHKFGERNIIQNGTEKKQLHDCGIIYYPNHPYVLCVMTRWYDWITLRETIQNISHIVYTELRQSYGISEKQ